MKDLELSALKSLDAAAAVDAEDAARLLDDTRVIADDFAEPQHRMLWSALEPRIRAKEGLDAVAIIALLPSLDRRLVADVITAAPEGMPEQRLRAVREASKRRQYLEALRAVARMVQDPGQPLAHAVAGAASLLSGWQDESRDVRAMDESVFALVDELEAVQQGKRNTTLATGIDALDAVIGGLQPTLSILGALPGVGKSALVAGIVRNVARRGHKVGLVSLEDERGWLTRRLVAEASGVPVFALANRRLSNAEMEQVSEGANAVHRWLGNILCDDRAPLGVADVVASARRMVSQGARAVLVDHIGELRLERTDRHDLDITEALQALRNLAKQARVPVVVVSHLRRREGLNVDTEPRLTDFAFSSGVERMARVAIGLWRGEGESLNATVLKQTQGVSGVTVQLRLNARAGVVVDSPAPASLGGLYG